MDLLNDLKWRGALEGVTNEEELGAELAKGPLTLYAGFDPTAASLHAGNLLPIIGLTRFQRAGHRPIALVGGATGLIGDPSGRDCEREFKAEEAIERNLAGIRAQLERFLDFSPGPTQAMLVNNYDWMKPISYIHFLRDVGKHFSINRMIQKDSVKNRLENRDQGISYTEFSYMLLQAYDFLHLYRAHNCRLQVGGSDQWGNIVGGIELVRRVADGAAYGLTFPLLTTASGQKFGKSVGGGSLWLDPALTSPYQFYQYWLKTEDADVVRFLKLWTFLEHEEIEALGAAHAAEPGKREAHRALARAVTAFAHGTDAVDAAIRASAALFGGSLNELLAGDFDVLAREVPTSTIQRAALEGEGKPLADLLPETTLVDSKGSARRELKGGGIYLNNQRVPEGGLNVTAEHLRAGRFLLLRKGKANYHLVKVEG